MNSSEHPGRSADFLSRLHDGELEPAERAHFEAHRAHCAECRAAASQFEGALAFFRASRPSPPSPDLAARILHKLQASNPPRASLGRSFGIDLKWAGAFAAALLAVIVGSSIVVEREGRRRAAASESAPIRVAVAEPSEPAGASAGAAAPATSPAPPSKEEGRTVRRSAPSRKPEASSGEIFAAPRPAGSRDEQAKTQEESLDSVEPPRENARRVAAAAPAPIQRQEPKDAQASASSRLQQQAAPPAAAPQSESTGGEGAAAASISDEAGQTVVRVRIVGAPDGYGTPPALLNAAAVALTGAERGEYRLVVRGDGSVASVEPIGAREKARRADASADKSLKKSAPPASEELKKLRFAVSDRPRQLVVRVE